MIVDNIKNASVYEAKAHLSAAFRYLAETDFSELGPGRQEIDGDKVFCVIGQYETGPISGARFEAHRKYIDVQYMVWGSEMIGVRPVTGLKGQGYDDAKDIEFFDILEPYSQIILTKGTFAVLYPHDAHMPGRQIGSPELIKKVVIKIAVD